MQLFGKRDNSFVRMMLADGDITEPLFVSNNIPPVSHMPLSGTGSPSNR